MRGLASTTRGAPASRPSTTSAGALCALNFAPIRSASRSTTMKPTLCRLPAYAGPGVAEADDQPARRRPRRDPGRLGGPSAESLSSRPARPRPRRRRPRPLALGGSLGRGGLLLVGRLVHDADLGLGLGQLGLDLLGGGGGGDVDDERLGVGDQGDAVGQRDVLGVDRGADLQALDATRRRRSGCAWPRPRPSACCSSWSTQVVRGRPRRRRGRGISTVTFSPRRTTTRSTCSRKPLIGSRWTSFGSASSVRAVDVEGEQDVRRSSARASARGRAARCAAGRCRGRRGRRAPCRRGGCGGRHPCRTRCGLGGDADLGHGADSS